MPDANDESVPLQQFVAATLTQIVRGAIDAQAALGDVAAINPPQVSTVRGSIRATDNGFTQGKSRKRTKHTAQTVEFDVQVTAASDKSSSAGGGVDLRVLSIGRGDDSTHRYEHLNRVRFAIPIVFDARAPVDQ